MARKKIKMRPLGIPLFLILFLFYFTSTVHAAADYVLPYPSFMPGNKLYVVKEFVDNVNQYFYFGDFAQFKYNLNRSDKYLVEAKTLFEYKQYLLGYEALRKSDIYFKKAAHVLSQTKQKDTTEKRNILKNAAKKHTEILQSLLIIVPESFLWMPEKGAQTSLSLKQYVNSSITLRSSCI